MRLTAKMAFFAIVATFAYLLLAIVGAGGFAAFFADPARIALTIVLFAQVGAALFTSANLSTGEQEDRSNRWVLAVFAVIGLLSGFLPAYTERVGFWTFGGEGVRWLGVLLFAVGGTLRLWPVFVLGRRFSGLVAIQTGHRLVTTGVYRFVRNPSYLGMLVTALGWAFVFRSGVGLVLTGLTLPPLIARIRAEEALLRAHFGAEYDAYCTRTWRLVPGIY